MRKFRCVVYPARAVCLHERVRHMDLYLQVTSVGTIYRQLRTSEPASRSPAAASLQGSPHDLLQQLPYQGCLTISCSSFLTMVASRSPAAASLQGSPHDLLQKLPYKGCLTISCSSFLTRVASCISRCSPTLARAARNKLVSPIQGSNSAKNHDNTPYTYL